MKGFIPLAAVAITLDNPAILHSPIVIAPTKLLKRITPSANTFFSDLAHFLINCINLNFT